MQNLKTLNLETNSSYTILNYIKDLLKKRFPNNSLKQTIHESEDHDKLNFACPFCGDSEKDSRKKRGNYRISTDHYKCYNDGCGVNTNIHGIVSKFKSYLLETPSISVSTPSFNTLVSSRRKGSLITTFISKNIGSYLLNIDDLASRFLLYPCREAKVGSRIYNYGKSRELLELDTYRNNCYFDSTHSRIYIFNIDNKSKLVIGLAIRSIIDTGGLKYNIKNYSEFNRVGLVKGIPLDILQDIDQLSNYFNVLNVDFSKPIIVTEGQFDSMFIYNSIASTGVTKSNLLLDNLLTKSSALVLLDSDSAGKNQSIQLLKKGYRVFLWSKILNKLLLENPIDKKKIKSIKDINDLFVYLSSIHSNYTLSQFNSLILQYFSESMLDIIFV